MPVGTIQTDEKWETREKNDAMGQFLWGVLLNKIDLENFAIKAHHNNKKTSK